jgi:hypothetical protein
MNSAKSLGDRIRGWFPQEPKISIIRSTNINLKQGRWVPLPSISGILLIVAALLSIYFGLIFSNGYTDSNWHVYYAGLPISVLHWVACGLELFSAALLITRRHTSIAVASMVTVLLLGLSIPLINILDQPTTSGPGYFLFLNLSSPIMWQNGLFLASPMIGFSIAGLIIVGLDRRRLQGTWGFSASVTAAALAVFWSILAAANIIQTNGLANLSQTNWLVHLSLPEQFAWLFVGAGLGAAISVGIARLQLSRLTRETKNHSRLRGWLLAIGVAVAVVVLLTGFLSLGLQADIQYGLLDAIFGCIAAVFVTRAALFLAFEKRQSVWVRQNGMETFTVAKEATSGFDNGHVSRGHILLSLKSVVLSSIVAAGFAGLIFVISDSWIKMALIVTAVLGCMIALAAKGKFRSIMKYSVVSLMIFCLCFTAYESITFSAVSGEPVLLRTTDLTMDKMGNLSLGTILDSIENGQVGSLLKLEHHELGTLRLIDIRLAKEGHVTIYYSTKNANQSVDLYSSDGYQFGLRVHDDYSDYPNLTEQDVRTSIDQIDALGLQWFYNQALQIAQNRTSTLHAIDTVVFQLNYDRNRSELTLSVSCHYSTPGSNYYPTVVAAAFTPNGTMINMSDPRETA